MKSGLLFCFSLILLAAAIACSSVSPGNDIESAAQGQKGGEPAAPAQAPESDKIPGEGNDPGLPAIEWPLLFRVSKVVELEQTEGKPELKSAIEERLQASTWEFFADGTFTYDTSRGVSTLYPIKGEYQLEDQALAFSGNKSHSYGSAGDSSVSIEGEINLNASAPVASIVVKEESATSTDDYGGTLSTNKTSTHSSKLLLEPVK